MNITRNGKIARLPKAVREELNRRLADGEQGKDLVVWLNELPEVRQVVDAEFGGRPIREQNLSEWKSGGYRDWLLHQEAMDLVRNLAADTDELKAVAEPLSDKLGLWLAARYAVATRMLSAESEGGELNWQRLRELCSDVVALRRGDHSAARLKIEQERLEREREQSEEELVAHFQRWAANPKVRDQLCLKHLSPEEREQRLRQIFGLPPDEKTNGAETEGKK